MYSDEIGEYKMARKKRYPKKTRSYYGREYTIYEGADKSNKYLVCSKAMRRQLTQLRKDYHIWCNMYDKIDKKYEWLIPGKWGDIVEHPINKSTRKKEIHMAFLSSSRTYSKRVLNELGDDAVKHMEFEGKRYKDLIVFPFSRLGDVAEVMGARARWNREISEKEKKRLQEHMKKIRSKNKK